MHIRYHTLILCIYIYIYIGPRNADNTTFIFDSAIHGSKACVGLTDGTLRIVGES